MCGISFYFSSEKAYQEELESSLKVTSHRGPDASGSYFKKIGTSYVGLGHNRLSIIDLSDHGKQPMTKSNVTISYNGEVYNYLEIRKELIDRGYEFISDSDTEVILTAYLEYGVECFKKLKGMFVFALVDENREQLYVVRDVIGIKPVYIFQDESTIYGCSEIKGLKEYSNVNLSVSQSDVFEFFNTGFLYEPRTGYEFINKLEPGVFLNIDLSSGIRNKVRYSLTVNYMTELSLSEKLKNSINDQEVADVPLGVFFSGGADSTILASLSNSSELLFAKYDQDDSSDVDLKYSKLIADYLQIDLKTVDIVSDNGSNDAILNSFDFVAKHTEELTSDYTFWSTYLISVAAKNNGYKVMLSGMGGDEAFAGYPRYLVLKYHKLVKLSSKVLELANRFGFFPKRLNKKFERLVSYSKETNWPLAYSRLLGYFSRKELCELFNDFESDNIEYINKLEIIQKEFKGKVSDKVKLAQHYDLTGFLAHNLTIADKASMLASIELRVPLLDESIVAHGILEKSSELIHKKILKYPLKKVLSLLIPSQLVNRPKTGFNPPLDNLIYRLGIDVVSRELEGLPSFLNKNIIDEILNDHFSKRANNTYKIWQLLYFARWMRHVN